MIVAFDCTFAVESSARILITVILQAIFIRMNTNHLFDSPGGNDLILHINPLITLSSPRHLLFIMFPAYELNKSFVTSNASEIAFVDVDFFFSPPPSFPPAASKFALFTFL